MSNRYRYQQNAMGACEGAWMESVVCPKPRRFGVLRCPIKSSHRGDMGEAATAQLLESILPEGCYDLEGPSSPFFLGSPPSRASNPLVQDARFVDEPGPPSPSARNGGGCARTKFGHKPAPVRIKGFDCRVSAVA